MAEAIEVSAEIPASPESIYEAWLDGKLHAAMTGAGASAEPGVGGKYTAWDGYIWGVNLELEPGKYFVQSWHTTEFPEGSEDSRLEVQLVAVEERTKVTLMHTNIPDGQGAMYKQGWHDHYFEPMKDYFSKESQD
ncbi:MAG: hypothetical protein DWQ07_15770 [Chloroflexi bacterium]|nr:MAG: hypothetical protein DWQ07_15770 [Chloroflexota bacterium]MBL1195209.1 hypothetical protein [Chloroflexota bacterium]NOH12494.1 hypothetical protein [Chloroflexota bacterium]